MSDCSTCREAIEATDELTANNIPQEVSMPKTEITEHVYSDDNDDHCCTCCEPGPFEELFKKTIKSLHAAELFALREMICNRSDTAWVLLEERIKETVQDYLRRGY